MARIKLTEQSSYEFSFRMQVRITDINIANHLGHVELIVVMHEARHQFFKTLGFNELNLGAENTGIVIIDLATNYMREAYAGDILDIDILLDDLREKSFRVYYRLKRENEIIALAETGIATFIYGDDKPVPVPQKFVESLNRFREQQLLSHK